MTAHATGPADMTERMAPQGAPVLERTGPDRRNPAGHRAPGAPAGKNLTYAHGGQSHLAHLEQKRSWKTRFFRALVSSPALFIIATIIAPGTVIGMRETIVKTAPVTAKLYAAFGLPVNLDGLDLRNVTSEIRREGGAKHLLVKGEIINLRDRTGKLPNLNLSLRGRDGRDIYTWQAPSPQKRIDRHASIRFLARLESPPGDAADVVVRFAQQQN